MEKITLRVDGMSCSHCVNSITKAVEAIEGVVNVEVDLKANIVIVEYQSQAAIQQIKDQIEDQGYEIVE